MLIEFRVSNFRSLRDEQVLSMVASNDKSLQDNTITTVHHAVSRLLKTAVVYGANASGKSNLIKALQFMRGVVLESASLVQPGQSYNLQAFRLDDAFAGQATQFELTFMLDNVRYQYGFAMTSERILAEHLLVYKTAKPQRWFERCRDEATGKDVATVKAYLQKKLDADSALTRRALYDSFRVAGTKTGVIIKRMEDAKLAKVAKVDADAELAMF
jgi:hypothetical protein